MEENSNMNTEAPGSQEDQPFTFTDQLNGQQIEFGPGFAGTVSAQEDVTLTKGGAMVIAVGRDAEINKAGAMIIPVGGDLKLTNGGASFMPIGGNVEIVNGGAGVMPIGGNLDLTNGGGIVMIGSQVTAKNSSFGVVLSGDINLEEGSRVLLDTKRAAAFGAAFGLVFALVSWLLRKK